MARKFVELVKKLGRQLMSPKPALVYSVQAKSELRQWRSYEPNVPVLVVRLVLSAGVKLPARGFELKGNYRLLSHALRDVQHVVVSGSQQVIDFSIEGHGDRASTEAARLNIALAETTDRYREDPYWGCRSKDETVALIDDIVDALR